MNLLLQQQFLHLIQQHMGLQIRTQNWPDVAQLVAQRAEHLQVSTQAYYELLNNAADGGTVREQEWQYFYNKLTTRETYFFRDRNQLQTLTDHILMPVIAQKRSAATQTQRPHLRIWSAGCSTGEETYSLAIALEKLIPNWSQWQILILGTDLSAAAITQAKQGIYRPWAFRQTDPTLQKYYFRQQGNTWHIDDHRRRQVTFRQGNLIHDPIPDFRQNLHSFDIILCRNVFIYFDNPAITQVLNKFWHALTPGGYLVTGHSELYAQDLSAFTTHNLPHSVVLQRPPD